MIFNVCQTNTQYVLLGTKKMQQFTDEWIPKK